MLGVTDASGRSYRAPIVVGADGNSARLGVQLGREHDPRRPMGVAVRSYYTSPRHEMDWMESYLQLWDGQPGESNLLPGYGWVFGMGDGTVNAGLGMLNTSSAFGKTDYRDLMRCWLDNTPEEWGLREANRLQPIRGAALPMAFNRKPLYRDGLLLLGDSGGMVSPFNGEGISYAMESAEMAARSIADAHARGFGSRGAELSLGTYADQVSAAWGLLPAGHHLRETYRQPDGDAAVHHLRAAQASADEVGAQTVANLTDEHDGDAYDRLINALSRIAPAA